MKKILKALLRLASFLSAVLSAVLITALLFGLRPYVVSSGSMEPLYPKGSVVLINVNKDLNEIKTGDVIAVRNENGTLFMHRLVGHNTLQGDANATQEHIELTNTNFIGKATSIVIPEAGDFINRKLSSVVALLLLAASILLPLQKTNHE